MLPLRFYGTVIAIVPKLIGADEKVNATRLEMHAGGVTANNLTQVARLGAKTGWIGFIGDDENGRTITKSAVLSGRTTHSRPRECTRDPTAKLTRRWLQRMTDIEQATWTTHPDGGTATRPSPSLP